MDWTNRGGRPNQSLNQSAEQPGSVSSGHSKRAKVSGWLKATTVILLFSATTLIAASLLFIAFGPKPQSEAKYVDSKNYQAVFLNGGQVYFGKITTINSEYIRLNNIYYLQVNQTVQPNGSQQAGNPTLVPLGCELHRPQNQMVINRGQVSFWENLKGDSDTNTVPGAIKKDLADNPNGHSCPANTATTNSSSSTTKK